MATCKFSEKRKRYIIRFYDQTGRRGWETLAKGTSARDAKKRTREIEDLIEKRTFKRPTQIPTFKEVAAEWLQGKKVVVRHSTLRQYQGHINNHLNPFFGNVKASEVALPLLERFVSHLISSGMYANTVRKVLTTLGSIMNYAANPHRCYAPTNPVSYVQNKPKKLQKEAEMATLEEIQAITEKMENLRDRLIVKMAAMGGLRMGEVFGLAWGQIRWRDSQVYIRRTYTHGRFYEPKSERSKRMIDISQELLHEFKKWKLACPNSEQDLVFPNDSGQPGSYDNWLKRVWHPARRKAGVRHLTPHSLRHFSGSFLLDQGEGMGYVQDHLGHSTIEMTMNIYRHKIHQQNRGAAKKFGEAFYGNGCKTGANEPEQEKSSQAT